MILAVGISGTGGQYFLTDAFRRAPASVVAPFEYGAILYAILMDWVLWGESPDGLMLLGAGVVVGGGLFVLYSRPQPDDTT